MPVLLVVGFLVAGAFVVERSRSDPGPEAVVAVESPAVTPGSVVSSAWFCAGGTAIEGGRADEVVVATNLGVDPVPARVTVHGDVGPDGRHQSAATEVTLAPGVSRRLRVGDILPAAEPGVTVEVFGGDVVVEHELRAHDDVTIAPCSDEASTEWYLAAGTTVRGAEEWVEIYNPFAADAVVSARFLLPDGERQPANTRGIVVEAHSRRSIAVHDELPRTESLGVVVEASAGRVVVDRTVTHDGTEGLEGIALTLGQSRLASTQTFAGVQVVEGRTAQLAVVNPADTDAVVTVSVVGAQSPPIDRLVPPGSQVLVPLAEVDPASGLALLPPGVWVSVVVESNQQEPVAVEILQESRLADPLDGLEVLRPVGGPATRWVATAPLTDLTGTVAVSVFNPGPDPATVQLAVTTGGRPLTQLVAPGQTVVVRFPTPLTPTTAPPTTAPPETAPPETAPPETVPPDTAPPDTAPPDTAPPVDPAATTVPADPAATTAPDTTTVPETTVPETTAVPETTTTAVPETTTAVGASPFLPGGAVPGLTVVADGAAVVVTSDRPVFVLRVLVGVAHTVASAGIPAFPA